MYPVTDDVSDDASYQEFGSEVALATPKEPGGKGQGNNPEQLFAAGYAACFLSAMKLVGTQGTHADKGFGLAVTLAIALPGLDTVEAEALVAEADTVCPYSHAVRGNIEVRLEVTTEA
ncbi:OsmC family protein [Novosphingobium taihuense]|uniref:OsmC family protein n=1 Tax=Novosphingobium taihuense TaxID=260085 RepID=UPI0023EEE340|nr:OsmC family protein [Novosphingobium taihuense]